LKLQGRPNRCDVAMPGGTDIVEDPGVAVMPPFRPLAERIRQQRLANGGFGECGIESIVDATSLRPFGLACSAPSAAS
jgi:hypothetical protein